MGEHARAIAYAPVRVEDDPNTVGATLRRWSRNGKLQVLGVVTMVLVLVAILAGTSSGHLRQRHPVSTQQEWSLFGWMSGDNDETTTKKPTMLTKSQIDDLDKSGSEDEEGKESKNDGKVDDDAEKAKKSKKDSTKENDNGKEDDDEKKVTKNEKNDKKEEDKKKERNDDKKMAKTSERDDKKEEETKEEENSTD